MKKIFKSASAVLATMMLVSCGDGGGNMEEVELFPVSNGSAIQYVNRKGEIIINPQFKEAAVFREGLALVQTSGDNPLWGYVDEKGNYAINPQYKEATSFSEGLAWVVEADKAPAAINKKGEVQFTLQQAENVYSFSEGLAAFSVLNEEGIASAGFVDKKGEVVINPQFSNIHPGFRDGLCGFMNDEGKCGFIDKKGVIVINPQFDEVDDFIGGQAVVKLGDKSGVIDKKGKYILNPQFDDMQADGDLFLIQQGGKFGWCDSKGTIVINPQFDIAFLFGDNKLAPVCSGKNWGYIDRAGKFVINPQFQLALPFNGSLAVVQSANRIGFIDKEGKYIVNPQFDDTSEDLAVYMITGLSEHNNVATDYFNMDAILSALNFNTPEGFSAQSTFNDVKAKYNLTDEKFSKTNMWHEVVSSKRIAKNTNISFAVYGKAYEASRVQQGSYYKYYSTVYNFSGNNKLEGFRYAIKNNDNKTEAIMETVQAQLKSAGYESAGNDSWKKPNNPNEVILFQQGSAVYIAIAFGSIN